MIDSMVYVGPLNSTANAFRRMKALTRMGLEVRPIDTVLKKKLLASLIAARLLGRVGYPPDWSHVNAEILTAVRAQRYGAIWIDGGRTIYPSTLLEAKQLSPDSLIVHYSSDNAFGHLRGQRRSFRSTIPFYDVHFVPVEENLDQYAEAGAKRVLLLGRGYCPEAHRSMPMTDSDKALNSCDVLFVGHWEPFREAYLAKCVEAGLSVRIIGKRLRWMKGRYWRVLRRHFQQGPVEGDDYAKALSGAKIVLNFYSKWNGDSFNSRMYEIPACGSFMLCERNEQNVTEFTEHVEAEYFESADELITKAQYYLSHDQERRAIAAAGLQRCHSSGYDYESRMKWMLGLIG